MKKQQEVLFSFKWLSIINFLVIKNDMTFIFNWSAGPRSGESCESTIEVTGLGPQGQWPFRSLLLVLLEYLCDFMAIISYWMVGKHTENFL